MDYDTDGTWWLGCEPTEPDYDRGYWTTKDDRRLKIETMETSHIKNTINLLKRNISKLEDYEKEYYEDYFEFKINELEEELKKRDVYKRHLESKEINMNGIREELYQAIRNPIQANKDKIEKLEKQNERLKKKNKSLQSQLKAKEEVIKEAINYIDNNTYYKDHKGHINIDDLYIILQKGSDSNE